MDPSSSRRLDHTRDGTDDSFKLRDFDGQLFWVWLLFGNEESREKSGDFGRCHREDDRKLPGYRGEGRISPGLALFFCFFSRQ